MGSKNYFQVGWGEGWGSGKKFKWGGDPTPLEFLQELPTTNKHNKNNQNNRVYVSFFEANTTKVLQYSFLFLAFLLFFQ